MRNRNTYPRPGFTLSIPGSLANPVRVDLPIFDSIRHGNLLTGKMDLDACWVSPDDLLLWALRVTDHPYGCPSYDLLWRYNWTTDFYFYNDNALEACLSGLELIETETYKSLEGLRREGIEPPRRIAWQNVVNRFWPCDYPQDGYPTGYEPLVMLTFSSAHWKGRFCIQDELGYDSRYSGLPGWEWCGSAGVADMLDTIDSTDEDFLAQLWPYDQHADKVALVLEALVPALIRCVQIAVVRQCLRDSIPLNKLSFALEI